MPSVDLPKPALDLVVRRLVHATPEHLFAAWTEPTQIEKWWGPRRARCAGAQVDLRVGGSYRIANRFADGRMVWIVGEFLKIEPPHSLVYSWRLEPGTAAPERVTVRFEPRAGATEVVILHERIPGHLARDEHEQGWVGCLDGLTQYLANLKE